MFRDKTAYYKATRKLHDALPPQPALTAFLMEIAAYALPSRSNAERSDADKALIKAVGLTCFKEPFWFPLPDYNEKTEELELARVQTRIEAKCSHTLEDYKLHIIHLLITLRVKSEKGPFDTKVSELLPSDTVHKLYWFAYAFRERFPALWETIRRNARHLSRGDDPLPPKESKLSGRELYDAYLTGTDFIEYLDAPVDIAFPTRERMNHTHILGKPGAGKTSLIENLIVHDLHAGHPIIVIDSQRDLIRRLAGADIWPADPILIDPTDVDYPVGINIFDPGNLGAYKGALREQVMNGAMDTFNYLFANVFKADLSAKQGTFFQFAVRLMFSMPEVRGHNATLLDLRTFMDDPAAYQDVIDALPEFEREFFMRDVLAKKTYTETREQVRYRLNAILGVPALRRCFSSRNTTVDLFKAMNEGTSVLIDTAGDGLGDASGDFGKFMLSLVLRAVLERAAIPEEKRTPVFLYIDECWQYMDTNVSSLLVQARKYQCGVTLAHQLLSQASSSLKPALMGATANKFAAPSYDDARALAGEMRSTAEFIANQPRLRLAAYINGVTPTAISVPVIPGVLVNVAKQRDYNAFIERNRKRVSYSAAPEPPTAEPFEESYE